MTESFNFINIEPKIQVDVVKAWNKAKSGFTKYFAIVNNLNVYVIGDFDQYCEMIGDKFRPKWGVTKEVNGNIFSYDPSKWGVKETGHSPKDLIASIKHEMFHVYCYSNKLNLPKWLEEGIATYISEDFDGGKKDKDFIRLKKKYKYLPDLPNLQNDFSSHSDHAWSYLTAYQFIKFIIETDGLIGLSRIMKKSIINNKLFIKKLQYKWSNFKENQNVK